ncbi:class I SAM-dependent methyltransferase family protein [Candidatus Woesearchaeota archaeon]|jgi:tRNA (guanine37-N1)-methyltransferase|nr:class I SAM-dependent methyltransferase family protein [Candidatus Woesearchaeota archaeon]
MTKVTCVSVVLQKAEDVKNFLLEKNLFNKDYSFKKYENRICFPIIQSKESNQMILDKFDFVTFEELELQETRYPQNLKDSLKEKLTKEELGFLKTSYDVVGTIAILEIDAPLDKKEKIIADEILKTNKNIKTVVKKADKHDGEFRTQKMTYIAGEETLETSYQEHNVRLKLNVEEVYFSPRLSTERKRIYEKITKGEDVLVMFSGCAPYPCVLSKNSSAANILGVEINPVGHKYGIENIKLNKLTNVKLINGDVREIVPKLEEKFDRILMPLPKTAEEFLDTALCVAKKGTIVHLYAFLHEDNFKEAHDAIDIACKNKGFKYKLLETVKCGQHAPRVYRICVDFEIL